MPGFGSFGFWEVLLILVVLLLVFGARRLPEIGSALGRGIREFKSSVRDIEGEISRSVDEGSRDIGGARQGPAVTGSRPQPPQQPQSQPQEPATGTGEQQTAGGAASSQEPGGAAAQDSERE